MIWVLALVVVLQVVLLFAFRELYIHVCAHERLLLSIHGLVDPDVDLPAFVMTSVDPPAGERL